MSKNGIENIDDAGLDKALGLFHQLKKIEEGEIQIMLWREVITNNSPEKTLFIQKENSFYMVSLFDSLADEESEVKSMTNYEASPGSTDIFGEYWSNGFLLVKKHESLIQEVILEFFQNGQVSQELMD